MEDKISNLDGVKLAFGIMESCESEFVECFSEEGITSKEGKRSKASRRAALLNSSWNMVR